MIRCTECDEKIRDDEETAEAPSGYDVHERCAKLARENA